MFYYAQMEVWGLTLCFAWVYSKQLVIPLTQGEDVCTTEPCTAGSWLHAGLPRAQRSHRNPGETKLRQVLGITTNKMPTLFLPDEIPTAFPLPIQLAIPTGDTTCLSHGQAKVFLCRNKGCLQDFHLSWDSRWGKIPSGSSNKRPRTAQSHLGWLWDHKAALLEMPKWSSWWFSTSCILSPK